VLTGEAEPGYNPYETSTATGTDTPLVQTDHYRLQLNVNNVTDAKYYPMANDASQIMPGAPRNAIVSLRVDF
jgi:outer membrane receptor protein involved in Fe transport